MSTNKARERRIQRETVNALKNPPEGVVVTIDEENLDHWNAIIDGPPDTPYEGGKFQLDIFLPAEFPYKPPMIKFATRVYHPNISFFGKICLDTLKESGWVCSMQITAVLQTIQQLLANPNLDDPLNLEVNGLWTSNPTQAKMNARDYTRRFAHA
ncbi:ubiquitin-conjugating enzyme E2, putative [Entamoeba invadens IP1]|uniref:ubiquitin-conjugating enzyme E2, putative n=1 Tax=Entamoeba invadens IP1 TaxID=370355 RepID=UPI0002C3DB30|nr:ubiquitin-conjugating enzyme E2, putative [Entamoeba invadens IP1]ELP93150.1 ubiquitin-conjugating enzyme E2, putative [Entamoeba invadens IP1]|eukprot:XP_004259921.1 ubiquitin-conjugating enzyme E2, putative [Entamoeba invadens IP1]